MAELTPLPLSESDIPADILVVDDTPHNLRLLSSLLTRKGYKVRSVLSGEMALKAAQVSPPDLVLLDINMPRMDGYEVCQRLKENGITQHIPIIFISALNDVVDKVKAFGVGAADYIPKPFQFAEVLVRVEHQLDLLRLRRTLESQNQRLEQEIRDRILIEAALQASEAELRALFAAMNDMILVFDREGLCRKVAPTKFDHSRLRFNPPHTTPNLRDIVPATEVDHYLSTIQGILASQETINVEYEMSLASGQRWFSANISPLSGELVLWVARDITASKLAETALRQEQERSETLLLNILPAPIAQRLKNQESTIADYFDSVTVLFADLVNFTELSTELSSTELVEILNTIFSDFDHLAARHGLEKIKTIGDAYMAVSGLPYPCDDHAPRVARMALELLDYIKQFNAETGKQFALRIGINTGSVVAGVIGVSKFGYDMWGDTVNVASRMESQGEPNRVQVTQTTYEHLKPFQDQFLIEPRGTVLVKGRGEMMTYWLARSPQDSPPSTA
ncbi:adenylate/guanylate cyclase domain-containing protein [Spirulina major CS-329]|uniref:adenylate/guanylate cyclase domain-containing protein n=1 Tax=Spirulina TaxID=1154 RepID=UPI00232FE31C|nr:MULTISPECIES: adenylate/guanylate cyclase domain-containing protein [Spirulina]MDB9496009.1 adenylate/guanylate cyclase domain-containing protein [Spirulina subsalsa CS-330]MDB9501806.1 adenylate/guanylate cyclase domain-containing protein [Spirulina major CS-329]